jgi:hypothetical protein
MSDTDDRNGRSRIRRLISIICHPDQVYFEPSWLTTTMPEFCSNAEPMKIEERAQ